MTAEMLIGFLLGLAIGGAIGICGILYVGNQALRAVRQMKLRKEILLRAK